MEEVRISLARSCFGEKEREAAAAGELRASLFTYDTGVEAIRLQNSRGGVVVLPYMGQMVWGATFDGVELAMQSMFSAPRPAKTIVETYGCLAYHCGILRSGVPGPGDNHALHGEAPCAEMDAAGIVFGGDARGPFIAATGVREYAMGFGAHYLATPRDRKSTCLNSSHQKISYAVFCLKKKKNKKRTVARPNTTSERPSTQAAPDAS